MPQTQRQRTRRATTYFLAILGCVVIWQLTTTMACGADGIKRSDVAFAGEADPEIYRQYGATLVAWGFRPWGLSGEAFFAEWKRDLDQAQSVGARYQARVELDAGWRGMIDFDAKFRDAVCLDLDGEPITYRFWNSRHKGHPPYYFCTNATSYRKYMIHQAEEALASEPDLLLIDAIHTTAASIYQGGCFCPNCMAGFRDYLAANVAQESLQQFGIESLEDFDYGAFLRGRGVTSKQLPGQIMAWPAKLPLAELYLTFQQKTARDFLAEFHRSANQIAGRSIQLGSSTALLQPKDWCPATVIDHFTIETVLQPQTGKIPPDQVFRYKLADALGKQILVTGTPKNDWAYVRDHNLTGMVRTWIAQSYAYGHNFMVPHNMWCGEGAARYTSRPSDYADLYQFVREHADLLDGYEPVAHVGLLYSHTAMRRWSQQAKHVALELTKRNIPFRFVVAGDDWLPKQLTTGDLDRLDAVIITSPSFLEPKQRHIVNSAADRIVDWPDTRRLDELVPQQIRVEGATNLSVLPRVHAEDGSAPGVCHLLNGGYDSDRDAMFSTSAFTLHLADSLYGRQIKSATILCPGQPPVPCAVEGTADGAAISIPAVELWAMLKLQFH